ncbi:unnamed protein product [Absidia cylindrospora]
MVFLKSLITMNNNEIINKDAQVAAANVNDMMVDDEGMKQGVVSSVKDKVTPVGLDMLLEERISLTKKALEKTVAQLNQVIGEDSQQESYEKLNAKANRLQEQLDIAEAR